MKHLFTLLFVTISSIVMAQSQYERLSIDNVLDWGWDGTSLSIDTLVFEVKPKGLYAEVGMYFDFSVPENSWYGDYDSLEIEMIFKLPEQVEVTDMWLWVWDTIVHAGMYDRWTANQIYEGIVNRRTDPAILYKYEIYDYIYDDWGYYSQVTYSNYYMFRIFPLMTTQPRKTKITYLVPIEDLQGNNPHIPLPENIINLSDGNIRNCKIKYFAGAGMGAPSVTDNSNFTFNLVTDPAGDYYEANANNVLGESNLSSLTLSMQNNITGNAFIGTYDDTAHSQQFYQLQIKPQDLFSIEDNKKALILFDFIDANSSMTGQQVIDGLKNQLLSDFDETDSINIMISGMVTNVLSDEWLPCDSATITDLFAGFTPSLFSNFTNLPTLFIDGIDFVQTHGNDANIILISSSNNHASLDEGNTLMENIFEQMGNNYIPVHTIDLDNVNSNGEGYYIGNHYYMGNEYLYTILASQTGAYFMQLYDYSYAEMLETVTERLSNYLNSFDIFVNLEQGFTYANYEFGQGSNLVWVDEPYSIVGKYNGSGNFRVIASAEAPTGELYYNEFIVDDNTVQTLDAATRRLWAGQQIREMYGYTQTNAVVSQIIYTSMGERVLSDYTAFLALEPGVGPLNNDDEGGPTLDTDEPSIEEMLAFEVYPNPANEIAYLNYYLPYDAHVTVELFDLFGKRVALLDNGNKAGGNYKLELNATALETGTYVCRMIVDNEEVITRKLVVVR